MFQDDKVISNLRERFVPVAVDQHVHRRLDDDEGALFAAVLKQAGRGLGGRSQGVYIFDPSGNLLAFSNTADAEHVKRLMTQALEKFDPDSSTGEIETAPEAPRGITPPPGTMVALVTSKVLGGYENVEGERTEIHAASLGHDHLWIREDEAAALVAGSVPDSLTQRLVRFHLVDNTRGEPPFWGRDEVKEAKLTIENGTLTGRVELETADETRGYSADLFGKVGHDEGKLTRFDLVAHGQYHGHGRFTRGAPPGEFPFAVAVRLVEPSCAADRVVPGAARGSVQGYLR